MSHNAVNQFIMLSPFCLQVDARVVHKLDISVKESSGSRRKHTNMLEAACMAVIKVTPLHFHTSGRVFAQFNDIFGCTHIAVIMSTSLKCGLTLSSSFVARTHTHPHTDAHTLSHTNTHTYTQVHMLPGQAGTHCDVLASVLDDAVMGWSAAAHKARLQLVRGLDWNKRVLHRKG